MSIRPLFEIIVDVVIAVSNCATELLLLPVDL